MTETLTIASSPAGLLNLSPAAAARVRELLASQDEPEGLYLRLGVKGGGCSGFSYVLELDRDLDPKYDRTFELEGVPVVVDRKSLVLLAGTTLDYTGELLGQGFEFNNPNATRGCGCGTSFQA